MKADRDRQATATEDLLRDNHNMGNKISALLAEHREVKNHWLAEKSDLQSRLCQVQALNTQISGTMKKKEKDFDKLQTQMAKLVKDANKTVKATMVLTAPLKKSLSQDQSNPTIAALLKDAELNALKSIIKSLESENSLLKSAAVQLKESVSQLTMSLTNEATKQPQPQDMLQIEEGPSLHDTPASMLDDISSPAPAAPEAVPAAVPGTITKKYLESTPGARVGWVVEQTSTEMRRLSGGMTPNVQGKLASLSSRLAEAMAVIQEQDRLIQQALLGSLPARMEDVVIWEVDEEEDVAVPVDQPAAAAKADIDALLSMRDSDFLPPASPETFELLQAYGWGSVPRFSSASQSRKVSFGNDALKQAGAEFCGEQLEF